MINLENSAPRCKSSIVLMIIPSQWQISLRCTANRSVKYTGLSYLKSTRTCCLWHGKLLPRSTFWMDTLIPKNHAAPPPATLTSASAASSVRTPSMTPPPLVRSLPPPGFFVAAAKCASSIPKDKCLTDLVQIGLYFCLCSCEYTKTILHWRTT